MGVFSYIILCFLPYFLVRISKVLKLESVLSPVVLCYGIGLLIGNFLPHLILKSTTDILSQATIAFAIPLILMTSDIKGFLNGTRNIILSFFLAISTVFFMCLLGAFIFNPYTIHSSEIAGMLAGVYTGGTPNMSSIKVAINANENIFGILNIADILMSGAYLIFLTSIGPLFFRKILLHENISELNETKTEKHSLNHSISLPQKAKNLIPTITLAFLCILLSAGISYIIYTDIKEALFIILITLFGISISFFKWSENLKGAYEAGDYLLLIFSLVLGVMSNFSDILQSSSTVLYFTAFVLFSSIIIHILLCKLFKIDADTVMITSAACIFGPVFIGQIVSVLKNKSMLVPGMAMGVMGYAIGSFLGISIHYLASNFF